MANVVDQLLITSTPHRNTIPWRCRESTFSRNSIRRWYSPIRLPALRTDIFQMFNSTFNFYYYNGMSCTLVSWTGRVI